jgi:DNA polymerase-3 subunit delta'
VARILDQVVGHREVLGHLLEAIEYQNLPSELIFYGLEGIGKKKLALGLVQILVCENSALGCGACGSCLRVEQGTSENLLTISPEKNLIKIEQSHAILEFLSLQAWSTDKNKITRRAVLIDDAHALNPQAANALLKVFEEPPENTYFFLITHRHRMLLPTIRSRAKMIGFQPLAVSEIKKIHPQADSWRLLASRGSLQNFLKLADPDEVRAQAVNTLQTLLEKPDEFVVSNWREELKDRDLASQYLRCWMLFLRDAVVFKSVPVQVISQDQMKIIELLAQYPHEKLQAWYSLLIKAECGIWAFQDPILIIENIFLSGFYHIGDEVYVD